VKNNEYDDIKPYVDTLKQNLKEKGIQLIFDTECNKNGVPLDNVVFKYNQHIYKIYKPLLFREFGISKDIMNNKTFYSEHQKLIINILFN